MALRVLSKEESLLAFELAKNETRPREIIELKEKIEAKIRVAELREALTGVIDEDLVHEIVQLKLYLDSLYGQWISREAQARRQGSIYVS